MEVVEGRKIEGMCVCVCKRRKSHFAGKKAREISVYSCIERVRKRTTISSIVSSTLGFLAFDKSQQQKGEGGGRSPLCKAIPLLFSGGSLGREGRGSKTLGRERGKGKTTRDRWKKSLGATFR